MLQRPGFVSHQPASWLLGVLLVLPIQEAALDWKEIFEYDPHMQDNLASSEMFPLH